MNRQQLNEKAILAKSDKTAAWEIKAHYLPLIEKIQTENWYKMNSETAFEDDCFRKINYAIRTYDEEKGDFDNRAKALIYQSLKEYCGRRGNRRSVLSSLDQRMSNDDINEDSSRILTLKDETVNVETQALEEVEKRELLEKYASNEMDKLVVEIIIKSNELLTQSEITRRLSKETGRTFNSARGVVRSFCARMKQGALVC